MEEETMKNEITYYEIDSTTMKLILLTAQRQLSKWMELSNICKETWQDTYNEITKLLKYTDLFKNHHYYISHEIHMF